MTVDPGMSRWQDELADPSMVKTKRFSSTSIFRLITKVMFARRSVLLDEIVALKHRIGTVANFNIDMETCQAVVFRNTT